MFTNLLGCETRCERAPWQTGPHTQCVHCACTVYDCWHHSGKSSCKHCVPIADWLASCLQAAMWLADAGSGQREDPQWNNQICRQWKCALSACWGRLVLTCHPWSSQHPRNLYSHHLQHSSWHYISGNKIIVFTLTWLFKFDPFYASASRCQAFAAKSLQCQINYYLITI